MSSSLFEQLCVRCDARPNSLLVTQMRSHEAVEILTLRDCNVSDNTAECLAAVLASGTFCPILRGVDFSYATLSYAAMQRLCGAFIQMAESHPTLTLYFNDNVSRGPRSLKGLGALLAQRTGIRIEGLVNPVEPCEESLPYLMTVTDNGYRSPLVSKKASTVLVPTSATPAAATALEVNDECAAPVVQQEPSLYEPSEEEILENRIASQYERLLTRMSLDHTEVRVDCSAEYIQEHEDFAEDCWQQYEEAAHHVKLAMKFENPFLPPEEKEIDSAACVESQGMVLFHAGNDGSCSSSDEQELLHLKRRLFLVEDALARKAALFDSVSSDDLSSGMCYRYHRLRQGETLADVARHFGVILTELKRANENLLDAGMIVESEVVKVPIPLERLLTYLADDLKTKALKAAIAEEQLRVAQRQYQAVPLVTVHVETVTGDMEEQEVRNETCDEFRALKNAATTHQVSLSELEATRSQYESLRVRLRDIEWTVFSRKRDNRLRFLKKQEEILGSARAVASDFLFHHETILDRFQSEMASEREAIEQRLRDAEETEEARELRLLKERVSQQVARCQRP